jgi:hypothetical protein
MEWQIGDALKADLEEGVWMVTEDRQKMNKDELEVMKGTFVRDGVPDCIVLPGWRFVVAYNDTYGLVPMSSLERVKLNPAVSWLVDEQPQGQAVADKDPEPEAEANEEQSENENDRPLEPNTLELKFFRAIGATDKMGQPTDKSLAIGGFDIKTGDILLDSTKRREGIPTVIAANGNVGETHLRRLQRLESAWGLPNPVQAMLVHEHNIDQIKINQSGPGAASSLYKHSLPLWRLTKSYSAANAQSETQFLRGEIVRMLECAKEGADCRILDFESKGGTVKLGDLQSIGTRGFVEQHDYPFGVLLREDIEAEPFENAEQPDPPIPIASDESPETVKSFSWVGSAKGGSSPAVIQLSEPEAWKELGSPEESAESEEIDDTWSIDPSNQHNKLVESADDGPIEQPETAKAEGEESSKPNTKRRRRDNDVEENPEGKKRKAGKT